MDFLALNFETLSLEDLRLAATTAGLELFGSTVNEFRVQLEAHAAVLRRAKLVPITATIHPQSKLQGLRRIAAEHGVDLTSLPPGTTASELRAFILDAQTKRAEAIVAADALVLSTQRAVEALRVGRSKKRGRSVLDLIGASDGFDDSYKAVVAAVEGFDVEGNSDPRLRFSVETPAVGQLVVAVRGVPEHFNATFLIGHDMEVFYLQQIQADCMNAAFVEALGSFDDSVVVVDARWPRLSRVLTLSGPAATTLRRDHHLDVPLPAGPAGGGPATTAAVVTGGHRFFDDVTGGSICSFDKTNVAARLLSSRVFRRLANPDVRRWLMVDDLCFDPVRIWAEVQRLGRLYETHGDIAGGSMPGIEYWRSVEELPVATKGASVLELMSQGAWGRKRGVSILDFCVGLATRGANAMKMALSSALDNFGRFLVLIAGEEYSEVTKVMRQKVLVGSFASPDWLAEYAVFEIDHLLEAFLLTLRSTSKTDFDVRHPGHSIDTTQGDVACWLCSLFGKLEPTFARQARFEREFGAVVSHPRGHFGPAAAEGGVKQASTSLVCKYDVLSQLKVVNKKGSIFSPCKLGPQCTFKHLVISSLPPAEAHSLVRDLFVNDKELQSKALKALKSKA